MSGITVTVEQDIAAPPGRVWQAITDPDLVQRYFFGSRVESTYQPGARISWRGEYNGQSYEDYGEILAVEPERRLEVTHYSPLSGQEDKPENYHRLSYELEARDGGTHLTFKQDNNATDEAAAESRKNWVTVFEQLKQVAESAP